MDQTAKQSAISPTIRISMWAGAALLLCVPLVAMQFTSEVDWSLGDFMVMGGMLVVLMGAIEQAVKRAEERNWRIAAIVASTAMFVFAWAILATQT